MSKADTHASVGFISRLGERRALRQSVFGAEVDSRTSFVGKSAVETRSADCKLGNAVCCAQTNIIPVDVWDEKECFSCKVT